MDQSIDNEADFDRSSKARRGCHGWMTCLSTYQQFLTEHKRKM